MLLVGIAYTLDVSKSRSSKTIDSRSKFSDPNKFTLIYQLFEIKALQWK